MARQIETRRRTAIPEEAKMIDSPFSRTQNGVFSIQEERIDRSSGECRMKFFLASTNITIELQPCFLNLVGKKFIDIKFALIENAADPYQENEKGFVYETRSVFEALGMQIERINLREYGTQKKNIYDNLKKFDVIWIGGGNIFYLSWIFKKSGFDVAIVELLNSGIVYGGGSAGAIIVGPALDKYDLVDDSSKSPEAINQSLCLTNLILVPHWGHEKYQSKLQEIKDYHEKSNGNVVVAISDHQAVLIDKNIWKVFP
ncbi:MAG: type 1 glutamine amidotransferase-like domain-containing protein [Proteobacteria bacterium]|nr:type 1 glutamine amidotransferase-like domain-containing protein [Pseudomonadota bacterium]